MLKNLPEDVRTRTMDAVRTGAGEVELRTRVESNETELMPVPMDRSEALWLASTPAHLRRSRSLFKRSRYFDSLLDAARSSNPMATLCGADARASAAWTAHFTFVKVAQPSIDALQLVRASR
jgi:hypothetical protein